MLPMNVSKSTNHPPTPPTPSPSESLLRSSIRDHPTSNALQAHPRSPLPSPDPPQGVPTPCLLNLSSGSLGTALCPQPTRSSKSPHWSFLLQLFCLPCQAHQINPPCLFPSPPSSSSAVMLPTAAPLERIWPKFQARQRHNEAQRTLYRPCAFSLALPQPRPRLL